MGAFSLHLDLTLDKLCKKPWMIVFCIMMFPAVLNMYAKLPFILTGKANLCVLALRALVQLTMSRRLIRPCILITCAEFK